MANLRHGGPVEEPPQDVFLSDDPALALVRADMVSWLKAHPCDCPDICRCDRPTGENPSYGPGNPDWEHDYDRDLEDDR